MTTLKINASALKKELKSHAKKGLVYWSQDNETGFSYIGTRVFLFKIHNAALEGQPAIRKAMAEAGLFLPNTALSAGSETVIPSGLTQLIQGMEEGTAYPKAVDTRLIWAHDDLKRNLSILKHAETEELLFVDTRYTALFEGTWTTKGKHEPLYCDGEAMILPVSCPDEAVKYLQNTFSKGVLA